MISFENLPIEAYRDIQFRLLELNDLSIIALETLRKCLEDKASHIDLAKDVHNVHVSVNRIDDILDHYEILSKRLFSDWMPYKSTEQAR